MRQLRVGTRASKLAMVQTGEVVSLLRASFPEIDLQVVPVRTSGDASPETPLTQMDRGMFVKEIEEALGTGAIDLAVHSLKDLPTQEAPGLIIGAVCRRADPRDVLVNRWGCTLDKLPTGARIGTSSPRREAQLKEARPDIAVLPIRGNVETRLAKCEGRDYDGAILAGAGLARLGLIEQVAEFLPVEQFVPAPGQGALAVQARAEDSLLEMLACLEDVPTRQAVTAERAFLGSLGGGCQMPMGAYGHLEAGQLVLTAFLASLDNSRIFRATSSGRSDNPQGVAHECHKAMADAGAVMVGL